MRQNYIEGSAQAIANFSNQPENIIRYWSATVYIDYPEIIAVLGHPRFPQRVRPTACESSISFIKVF